MGKRSVKEQATAQSKAVATTNRKTAVAKGSGGLPAYLAETKMTGKGVSTDASDNLVPMARVLQKMSPEVEKKGVAYIAGAEAGDIFIKNTANPIIKGEAGFLFQPCYFSKGVVEWLPRAKGGGGGGGFVALHPEMPSDAVQAQDPQNEERKIWVRKSNKNLLVETRYHGGYIIVDDEPPQPAILPFSGSGHTVSKTWMMLMNRKQFNGTKADSYAVYYRFRSVLKNKNNNTWHLFEITDAGEQDPASGLPTTFWAPSVEDFERGKSLHDSLASGARVFNAEDSDAAEENAGGKDGKI